MTNQDPEFDPQAGVAGSDADAPMEQGGDTDDLSVRIEQLENELGAAKDEILRERAEIMNRQSRMAREMEMARKFANEKLLAELLPVIDALEAGLATAGTDGQSLREGMELTYRALLKVAENNGLTMVDPVGTLFDPERHQAIQMIESDAVEPGHVISVFQKGWVLNDRLLRPAMVVVRAH